MKLILLYLTAIMISLSSLGLAMVNHLEPTLLSSIRPLVYCMIASGIGGVIYCYRGVYVNACVHQTWSESWYPWYYIRPIVSVLMGGVCFVFLNAGLLVLEASKKPNASQVAFLAVSFIAGLNVDKFISKIEDIAKTAWGIDKSRAGSNTESKTKLNTPPTQP